MGIKEWFYYCDPCGSTNPPSCFDACGLTLLGFAVWTLVFGLVLTLTVLFIFYIFRKRVFKKNKLQEIIDEVEDGKDKTNEYREM